MTGASERVEAERRTSLLEPSKMAMALINYYKKERKRRRSFVRCDCRRRAACEAQPPGQCILWEHTRQGNRKGLLGLLLVWFGLGLVQDRKGRTKERRLRNCELG